MFELIQFKGFEMIKICYVKIFEALTQSQNKNKLTSVKITVEKAQTLLCKLFHLIIDQIINH